MSADDDSRFATPYGEELDDREQMLTDEYDSAQEDTSSDAGYGTELNDDNYTSDEAGISQSPQPQYYRERTDSLSYISRVTSSPQVKWYEIGKAVWQQNSDSKLDEPYMCFTTKWDISQGTDAVDWATDLLWESRIKQIILPLSSLYTFSYWCFMDVLDIVYPFQYYLYREDPQNRIVVREETLVLQCHVTQEDSERTIAIRSEITAENWQNRFLAVIESGKLVKGSLKFVFGARFAGESAGKEYDHL